LPSRSARAAPRPRHRHRQPRPNRHRHPPRRPRIRGLPSARRW
jgi:hypothetical protein